MVPAIGPAIPICACRIGLCAWERWKMAAPRNGMKIGAVAAIPWRRISTTCPISCTKIIKTRPTANHGPPKNE
jgi:hypothetical protein